MPKSHAAKVSEISPSTIKVNFSPEVRAAFRTLAAAVHFSQTFDPDMRNLLDEWASDKPQSLYNILIGYPAIAHELAKHFAATKDKNAQDALLDLSSEMVEHGFTLTRARKVTKD
jgi:hypothetical protein